MNDLISRQAAIKEIIETYEYEFPTASGAFDEFATKIVPNVLKNLPSAQPERRYDEWCTDCKEYDQEKHCCPRWNRVIRTTLQDAQRTGRWIEDSGNIACSECHIIWLHRRTAFCPNCGARMEEERWLT